MKKFFLIICFAVVINAANAQQTITEATLEITMNITFPESDLPPVPEGAQIRRFGDGEVKSKVFYKNGNMKMESDMGMGKNLMFYTAENKTTTTLMEVMGRKMGFYSNEEDLKKMLAGDTSRQRIQSFKPEVFVEYLSDTKKLQVSPVTKQSSVTKIQRVKINNRKFGIHQISEWVKSSGSIL